MIVECWIAGLAAPQGSKRHVGNGVMVESNAASLRPFRQAVAREAALALGPEWEPTRAGVNVELTFAFPRPAGHFGTGRNAGELRRSAPVHKTTKPDLDKLIRSVLDALTGVVFVDDAQVVRLVAAKRFGLAGVDVSVEFADESETAGLYLVGDAVRSNVP